jgi:hypothetical protein
VARVCCFGTVALGAAVLRKPLHAVASAVLRAQSCSLERLRCSAESGASRCVVVRSWASAVTLRRQRRRLPFCANRRSVQLALCRTTAVPCWVWLRITRRSSGRPTAAAQLYVRRHMADIEAPLRAQVRAALEDDFTVLEEVSGTHKHGGERIRYDLVLLPRQHLLDSKFEDGCVVVEVKYFNESNADKHGERLRDMLWQCVVYSFSELQVEGRGVEKPLFVLYFIGGTGVDPRYVEVFKNLRHFVSRGGVGSLELHPKYGWSMNYGANHYYRKSTGRGPHNVLVKRQTGSSR